MLVPPLPKGRPSTQLQAFSSQHVADTAAALLAAEPVYAIPEHPLRKQPKLSASYRAQLNDWLRDVCYEYQLKRSTYALAVCLLDRFFALCEPMREQMELQVHGLAALFISGKIEEIYPPTLSDYYRMLQGNVAKGRILQAEAAILSTLQWRLRPPTSADWLMVLCQAIGLVAATARKELDGNSSASSSPSSSSAVAAVSIDDATAASSLSPSALRCASSAVQRCLSSSIAAASNDDEHASSCSHSGIADGEVTASETACSLQPWLRFGSETIAALLQCDSGVDLESGRPVVSLGVSSPAACGSGVSSSGTQCRGNVRVPLTALLPRDVRIPNVDEEGQQISHSDVSGSSRDGSSDVTTLCPSFPAELYLHCAALSDQCALHAQGVNYPPSLLAAGILLERTAAVPGFRLLLPVVEAVVRLLVMQTVPVQVTQVAARACNDGGCCGVDAAAQPAHESAAAETVESLISPVAGSSGSTSSADGRLSSSEASDAESSCTDQFTDGSPIPRLRLRRAAASISEGGGSSAFDIASWQLCDRLYEHLRVVAGVEAETSEASDRAVLEIAADTVAAVADEALPSSVGGKRKRNASGRGSDPVAQLVSPLMPTSSIELVSATASGAAAGGFVSPQPTIVSSSSNKSENGASDAAAATLAADARPLVRRRAGPAGGSGGRAKRKFPSGSNAVTADDASEVPQPSAPAASSSSTISVSGSAAVACVSSPPLRGLPNLSLLSPLPLPSLPVGCGGGSDEAVDGENDAPVSAASVKSVPSAPHAHLSMSTATLWLPAIDLCEDRGGGNDRNSSSVGDGAAGSASPSSAPSSSAGAGAAEPATDDKQASSSDITDPQSASARLAMRWQALREAHQWISYYTGSATEAAVAAAKAASDGAGSSLGGEDINAATQLPSRAGTPLAFVSSSSLPSSTSSAAGAGASQSQSSSSSSSQSRHPSLVAVDATVAADKAAVMSALVSGWDEEDMASVPAPLPHWTWPGPTPHPALQVLVDQGEVQPSDVLWCQPPGSGQLWHAKLAFKVEVAVHGHRTEALRQLHNARAAAEAAAAAAASSSSSAGAPSPSPSPPPVWDLGSPAILASRAAWVGPVLQGHWARPSSSAPHLPLQQPGQTRYSVNTNDSRDGSANAVEATLHQPQEFLAMRDEHGGIVLLRQGTQSMPPSAADVADAAASVSPSRSATCCVSGDVDISASLGISPQAATVVSATGALSSSAGAVSRALGVSGGGGVDVPGAEPQMSSSSGSSAKPRGSRRSKSGAGAEIRGPLSSPVLAPQPRLAAASRSSSSTVSVATSDASVSTQFVSSESSGIVQQAAPLSLANSDSNVSGGRSGSSAAGASVLSSAVAKSVAVRPSASSAFSAFADSSVSAALAAVVSAASFASSQLHPQPQPQSQSQQLSLSTSNYGDDVTCSSGRTGSGGATATDGAAARGSLKVKGASKAHAVPRLILPGASAAAARATASSSSTTAVPLLPGHQPLKLNGSVSVAPLKARSSSSGANGSGAAAQAAGTGGLQMFSGVGWEMTSISKTAASGKGATIASSSSSLSSAAAAAGAAPVAGVKRPRPPISSSAGVAQTLHMQHKARRKENAENSSSSSSSSSSTKAVASASSSSLEFPSSQSLASHDDKRAVANAAAAGDRRSEGAGASSRSDKTGATGGHGGSEGRSHRTSASFGGISSLSSSSLTAGTAAAAVAAGQVSSRAARILQSASAATDFDRK